MDPTIEAAIIGDIALLLGSVLTIGGGFIATFFLQKMTSQAEKRKVVRQKIEEIYLLSNRMEEYSITRTIELVNLTKGEYLTKYMATGRYLLEEDATVAKIKMMTSLYIPELKKQVEEYRLELNRANRRIDNEIEPKVKRTTEQELRDILKDVSDDIRSVHEKFVTALLEIIDKN